MLTISTFFGILIRMYFDDHGVPHFHVYYAEYEAKIAIDSLEVIEGGVPRRALALVLEWAAEHREELRTNWQLALDHQPLHRIDPLR